MLLVGVWIGACGGAGCAKRRPAPSCPTPEGWQPGTLVFEEVTDAWGLTGVEGVRLQAVDFDGDGWIDLHVHRGTETGEGRRSWLLHNEQGRFVDVTASSGIRDRREGPGERAGSVVVFGDVDNDGDLDVFTGVTDPEGTIDDTSELLLNQGDGTFALGSAQAPWRVEVGAPAGATFTDVDRDGLIDLWVPQNIVGGEPQQDRLYRNLGDGRFVDVTEARGLRTEPWDDEAVIDRAEAHSNGWAANACDLDGDGWPELLAPSYGRAPNHLWHNSGGRFENASLVSHYASDDDQRYVDNQFYRCFCTENAEAPRCRDAPAPSISCERWYWSDPRDRRPFRSGGNSATTSCRDVDNDGDLDLLTGEIQHWWAGPGSDEARLLINDGTGVFDRPALEQLGLTRTLAGERWDKGDMTNSFLDFDADGWVDVYIGSSDYPGTRGLLWRQVAPLRFEEVATADFFEQRRSHGVAVADFDRDGMLDIVVGHSRFRCGGECYPTQQIRLFRNRLSGNTLSLDLVGGQGANRSAVGARVQVTTPDLTQTLEVGSGFGHFGLQSPHRLVVGLGSACEATVEVRWPDAVGTEQSWRLARGYHQLTR